MNFVLQLLIFVAGLYAAYFALKFAVFALPALFKTAFSATRTLVRDSSERADKSANFLLALGAPDQSANDKIMSSDTLSKRGAVPLVESEGVSKIVSRFDGVLTDTQVDSLSKVPAFIRKQKGQLGHA